MIVSGKISRHLKPKTDESQWIEVQRITTLAYQELQIVAPHSARLVSLHVSMVRSTDKFKFRSLEPGDEFDLHVSEKWVRANSLID